MSNDQENITHYLHKWFSDKAGISVAKINHHWPVFPEEEAFITHAIPQRRAEFATGRQCAREALRQLGFAAQPLLVGTLRQPLWPHGTIGSLTHDGELCAVVVLIQKHYHGIGIDIAQKQALNEHQLMAMVASAQERMDCQTHRDHACSPLLLFSIKESIIKAISSHVGHFIDMQEINVQLVENGTFMATHPKQKGTLSGYWVALSHFWLTAAISRP